MKIRTYGKKSLINKLFIRRKGFIDLTGPLSEKEYYKRCYDGL